MHAWSTIMVINGKPSKNVLKQAAMETYLLPVAALLLLLAHVGNPLCDFSHDDGTLKVFHASSPCSPLSSGRPHSSGDAVLHTQARDNDRLLSLTSLQVVNPGVPVASGRQILDTPAYILFAQVGTPLQTLLMAIDTASDAAWIPCTGCGFCSSAVFNVNNSTTFSSLSCKASECSQAPNSACGPRLQCSFNAEYKGSVIFADLSKDTLTLGNDTVPKYAFGCLTRSVGVNVPAQGVLGLGRGPLSLMSQGRSVFKSTFSYCLPSILSFNFTGSLRLGLAGQPKKIRSTQLLWNPRNPSLYYVKLAGIRFGGVVLDIPDSAFDFNIQTGAGTIIDTGVAYTRLVPAAYTVLRDEFRAKVGGDNVVLKRGDFDTCYKEPLVSPSITLIFSGFELALPPENFLIQTAYGNVTCLAMVASPANAEVQLNVIGSMQQQNYRVLIDIPHARVGFSREECSVPIV